MSKYTIIGGGWNARSKDGIAFIRIRFKVSVPEDLSVTMWKNTKKNGDKSPDYLLAAYVKDEENGDDAIF